MNSDTFLTFVRNAEQGVKERGLFEGRGPLAILLLVLVGGLALNLTPCVLPMIPINLAIIGAGAKASSRSRGFVLGGVYGAAMAAVYGILGVVVILTAGTFGTINASPWFNVAIAVVFVALALAMFDVFEIDFSRFSSSVGTGGAQPRLARAGLRHGGHCGAAGRCLRRAGRHSGRALLEQSLRAGQRDRARPAVRARHRHGDSLADRRRRLDAAAETGRVDGAREAGARRRDPRHRGLLRLPRLHALRRSLGGCRRGDVERRGAGQGRLARVARRRAWRWRDARRSRCSWTCGPRGARTA